MSEDRHPSDNPGEVVIFDQSLAEWARGAEAPPVAPLAIGDTMVNVDWFQLLAAGFPPALRAVTVEERAASCDHLYRLLDDVAGAAHLGPFEAEEAALGAMVVGLLRHAQARGTSLWAATNRALNELALAEGERFLAERARP